MNFFTYIAILTGLCIFISLPDLNSQSIEGDCETRHKNAAPDRYWENNFLDYIRRHYQYLTEYIIPRPELKSLDISLNCHPDSVSFNGTYNDIELKGYMSRYEVALKEEFELEIMHMYEDVYFIVGVNGYQPYGHNGDQDTAVIFKDFIIEINGKRIDIPEHAYFDLFFPNFCTKEGPIVPISFYFDPRHENIIYLYIFGKNRLYSRCNSIKIEEQRKIYPLYPYFSFKAKLIIDIDSGYIGRIAANNHELRAYQYWLDCFIGF